MTITLLSEHVPNMFYCFDYAGKFYIVDRACIRVRVDGLGFRKTYYRDVKWDGALGKKLRAACPPFAQ